MSFDPKKTDVDKHIDLINTLGDMVDQKEEAKMEKFIETMPTMIQTHLIICENWADVTDKAKSLKHIIQKCDPPTLEMPLVTMGATVPGLYSHIAHSVDKEEEEIPPPKPKLKQIRGRGTTMIITPPQVQIEAADLLTVKVVTGNLEASCKEAEAKDLSITNANFKIIDLREAHLNIAIINMALTANSIFREIKQISHGRANYQSNNDTYQYQYYTHDQQTEQYVPVVYVVYAVVLIIPLSTATKENMT